MRPTSISQLCAIAVVSLTSASGSRHGAPPYSDGDLVADARLFMDGVAHDLRGGDRDALAGRYDPRGAYFVGNGRNTFRSLDSIRVRYRRPTWQPPHTFAWRDLAYEVVGPEAVVVTGRFEWEQERYSYTGLLVRQGSGGPLRLRLEDESADPSTLPPPPCSRDSIHR